MDISPDSSAVTRRLVGGREDVFLGGGVGEAEMARASR